MSDQQIIAGLETEVERLRGELMAARDTSPGGLRPPPPEIVRAELARSVRESRRLRTLLKLSLQEEADRKFIARLYRDAISNREAPSHA